MSDSKFSIQHSAGWLFNLPIVALLASLLTANSQPIQSDMEAITYTYERSEESILNPERGFFDWIELLKNGSANTEFGYVRENNASLAFAYIRLDEFLDSPISDERLIALETALAAVRDHGVKLIVRIAYNIPGETPGARDASLARVRQHSSQLAPLLRENADVIAFVQAGIIGRWGEWHSASAELETGSARRNVLETLLETLPDNIFIQMRRPAHLQELFPKPISKADAFNRSAHSRIGHHNDCFLSSHDDVGTYHPAENAKSYRDYIRSLSKYAPIGGETCTGQAGQRRTSCHQTQKELREFRWTYLNRNYLEADITRWKHEGCFKTIGDSLGYRYRLENATFPNQVRLGRRMKLSMSFANDGYAPLYNPRGAELVFVADNGVEAARIDLTNHDAKGVWFFGNRENAHKLDPRIWLPQPGERRRQTFTPRIPESLMPGAYRLMLAFPDPHESLKERSDYAIRLANKDIWVAETGLNDLGVSITLTP